MAQKESQHRQVVEDLHTQLTHTRRQLDDLTTLSRDQVRSDDPPHDAFITDNSQDCEHVHGT